MIVKKVGKITLAATLIGTGLVLLAEKFLTIPFRDLFKFWPLLLVALGLEMIFSVFLYGRKNDIILKFDKIALMGAIIFSLIASGVTNTFGFADMGPQLMLDGMKYKHQKAETFTKDNISAGQNVSQIIVDSSFGNIELKPSDEKNIRAEVNATLHFNDKNAISGGLEKLISITEGSVTTIKVNAPENFAANAFSRTKLILTVYVPDGIAVQASNSFGDIKASELNGKVVLVNKHGELDASNITGTLNAENSFGSIEVDEINGDTKIINRNGSISVSSINGNLETDNNFGSTEISEVSGNTIAKGSNGSIKAVSIEGNLTATNSFGKINASEIGKDAQITNSNGAIELSEASGNIRIKSSFGSVKCESNMLDNSRVDLKTSFGSIQPVNGISPTEATSSSKLVNTFGSGAYSIVIENANGDIILE